VKLTKDFRPTLFFLTVVVALFVVMGEAPNDEPQLPVTASSFLRYQTLNGYFLQDDPKTNPSTFNYVRRLTGGGCGCCFFSTVACIIRSLTAGILDSYELWPH
jgi:hypothetical protein